MALNERIDNVPAGHTSPSFHPHRNTALLHVDQVIDNHETVASGTVRQALLVQVEYPLPYTLNVAPPKTGRPAQRLMWNKANVMPVHKSAG